MGLAAACSLVGGAGSWPSGEHKGLSRGGSRCRKILGSLSVNEWDCIPVPLVVWLKAFSALEPTGCWLGPGLDANNLSKMSSIQNTLRFVGHHLLCPQKEPQPTTSSPGDPPRRAGRSGGGAYEVTAHALCPGACETLCAPFKHGVSVSPSPMACL